MNHTYNSGILPPIIWTPYFRRLREMIKTTSFPLQSPLDAIAVRETSSCPSGIKPEPSDPKTETPQRWHPSLEWVIICVPFCATPLCADVSTALA